MGSIEGNKGFGWLKELPFFEDAQFDVENFQRAVDKGNVLLLEGGKFTIVPKRKTQQPFFVVLNNHLPAFGACSFLNIFLFKRFYQRQYIPYGCRGCFKVKVIAKNLAEFLIMKELASSVESRSKWGAEPHHNDPNELFVGYFYAHSRIHADEILEEFKGVILKNSELDDETTIFVKRGCTNFKNALGEPEDWVIETRLKEIEEQAFQHYVEPEKIFDFEDKKLSSLARWVNLAHNNNDLSYVDFFNKQKLDK